MLALLVFFTIDMKKTLAVVLAVSIDELLRELRHHLVEQFFGIFWSRHRSDSGI